MSKPSSNTKITSILEAVNPSILHHPHFVFFPLLNLPFRLRAAQQAFKMLSDMINPSFVPTVVSRKSDYVYLLTEAALTINKTIRIPIIQSKELNLPKIFEHPS